MQEQLACVTTEEYASLALHRIAFVTLDGLDPSVVSNLGMLL